MTDSSSALPDAVLGRLEQISSTLDETAKRIEAVAGRERRTRLLAIGMLVSFALDIALTVIVTVLSVNALSQASSVHQSQLAACAISNQTRVEQITLWNYVIQLSGQNPNADKAQLAKFEAFVKQTFKPVNCAKVYR